MGMEFKTVSDVVVAKTFWGGKSVGKVCQMNVTEKEFEAFANMEVFDEGNVAWDMTFTDWVADRFEDSDFRWDNAERRNQQAREMEQWVADRFGDANWEEVRDRVEKAAVGMRGSARSAAKDDMSVV